MSLAFITGLPPYQSFTVILVVVDHFSNGVHFGLLPACFTAHKVASLFIDIVCKLYGFPKSLVSCQDPVFMSLFWKELFKLNGTKLRMSTAYHPQSDGQIEVLNRILEQYLRAYVHHKPSLWGKFLSLAEWCYNTSTHSGTGLTPFQVTFGKPPPNIPYYLTGSSIVEAVDSLLSSREDMMAFLKAKLLKAQQQMKKAADEHRRDVSYKVGDWVYVKLRPYRQLSVSGAKYTKLGKRFYGPCRISEVIGSVTYKLDLPLTTKIHLVFHCSLLKPHQGTLPSDSSNSQLLDDFSDHNPVIQPLSIVDSKWDNSTSPPRCLVLVQWLGLPPEDTTWEDWNSLNATYITLRTR